jgi:hypothetical protein
VMRSDAVGDAETGVRPGAEVGAGSEVSTR